MARNLYAAHTAAGAASGRYKASLYDIADVGSQIEYIGKEAEQDRQQTENVLGAVSSGLELTSTIYGGYLDKKEFEGASADVQERMAEQAYHKEQSALYEEDPTYQRTSWEKLGVERKDTENLKGEVRLGEEKGTKSEWMEKFAPKKVQREGLDRIFGGPAEWEFGGAGAFKKSDIIAAHKLGETTDLEDLLNLGDKRGQISMWDEYQGPPVAAVDQNPFLSEGKDSTNYKQYEELTSQGWEWDATTGEYIEPEGAAAGGYNIQYVKDQSSFTRQPSGKRHSTYGGSTGGRRG